MRTKKLFSLFSLLGLIYVWSNFGLPPNEVTQMRYHLSFAQLQLLRVTLVVPILAIWFVAFYGYSKFKEYSELIKESPDGKALSHISTGLLVLAIWLPVNSIVSNVTAYWQRVYPNLTPSLVIFRNYLALAIVLGAFWCIHKGARELLLLLLKGDKNSVSTDLKQYYKVVFLAASLLLVYLTFSNPARQFPTEGVAQAAYYLPDFLIFLTIIIPYVAILYLGLSAFQFIHTYGKKVTGIIYAQALKYLANGIGVTVMTIMLLRYLTSMASILTTATLKVLLLIIYLLVAVIGVGYILIAIGAKKLKKIEEV